MRFPFSSRGLPRRHDGDVRPGTAATCTLSDRVRINGTDGVAGFAEKLQSLTR
jgi:hypothetical protein